jgi:hypothetical protein
VLLVGAAATVGCASNAGPAKSPVAQAADMERTRCAADIDEKALEPVLSGQAIEGVQPFYASVESAKSGMQSEIAGATIRVRALQGVTAEWLDRALECHSARRVLGRIPESATPSDPFWLPGRAVDIDAQSARDGFLVAVRGSTTEDARAILARANGFVASASTATPAGRASR